MRPRRYASPSPSSGIGARGRSGRAVPRTKEHSRPIRTAFSSACRGNLAAISCPVWIRAFAVAGSHPASSSSDSRDRTDALTCADLHWARVAKWTALLATTGRRIRWARSPRWRSRSSSSGVPSRLSSTARRSGPKSLVSSRRAPRPPSASPSARRSGPLRQPVRIVQSPSIAASSSRSNTGRFFSPRRFASVMAWESR